MRSVNKKTRLDQLSELRRIIGKAIDEGPGARDLASLAKQYAEITKEIDEITGGIDDKDEIAQILGGDDGQPRAVRPDRSGVQRE